ncbi:S41 family peptidase [Algibacillus agarilyticus]|uniref:S41 family peptidase n=1 Tax=Algibacillus agarilyticus TaxID=2234133 RepID=UPI000DD07A09|nr:S41 family peptidase [Algibacillus agarilyticus]
MKNSISRFALFLAINLTFSLTGCSSTPSFQDQVKKDVSEIKRQIKATHPAFLAPNENKEFISWWETGDQLVEEKRPLVQTQHDATALLNFYILGYNEPHMTANRYIKCKFCLNIPVPFTQTDLLNINIGDAEKELSYAKWSGFFVDLVNNEFVVAHTSQNWPIDLPPIGSKLHSCNKQSVKDIYYKQILPYVDHRREAHMRQATAFFTFSYPSQYPILAQQLHTSCNFQLINGSLRNYALTWQGIEKHKKRKDNDWRNVGEKFNSGRKPKLGIEKKAGLTWVSVPSFSFKNSKVESYNRILSKVQKLEDNNKLVIDLRGNRGGSVFYMAQLIQSVYPSIDALSYSDTPEPEATLKVSKQLIEFYLQHLKLFEKAEQNSISPKLKFEKNTVLKLSKLLQNHEKLDEPLTITKQKIPELFNFKYKNNTRQKDFRGQVILVTADDCFSACLTFIDLLSKKENVIHAGKITDADTKHLNNITIRTSNNKFRSLKFVLPIMHFTNRAREDNAPIIPDYQYSGFIWDTDKVKNWILKTVLNN